MTIRHFFCESYLILNYNNLYNIIASNDNASETKANKTFGNGVFFDIEAKWTPSLESKLFSKRSEHIR